MSQKTDDGSLQILTGIVLTIIQLVDGLHDARRGLIDLDAQVHELTHQVEQLQAAIYDVQRLLLR